MGEQCDCCESTETRKMDATNCRWCADWFHGVFCDECYVQVEKEMQEVCEAIPRDITVVLAEGIEVVPCEEHV